MLTYIVLAIIIVSITILLIITETDWRHHRKLTILKKRNIIHINNQLQNEADNLRIQNSDLKDEVTNLNRINQEFKSAIRSNLYQIIDLQSQISNLEQDLGNRNSAAERMDIPDSLQALIFDRINLLNQILAAYISNDERFATSSEKLIKELASDHSKFMSTIRLSFQAIAPDFIQYLNNKGLSDNDINYLCLYAIGLNGKQVGYYLKKNGHINLSSAIRKKLGLTKSDTNIGIYVRNLLSRFSPGN